MQTNIVSVKYEDKFLPRTFGGKAYSYFTEVKLKVGDLVEVPTKYGTSIAKITRVDVPEDEIETIKPYMKTITRRINRERYLNFAEVLEDVA